MTQSIPTTQKEQLFNKLKEANTSFQQIYPGDRIGSPAGAYFIWRCQFI